MAGTRAGRLKAAATNKARHGDNFYAEIGRKGGESGHGGGFASMTMERLREVSAKGGRISRRGPAKKDVDLNDYPPSLRGKVKEEYGLN